MLDRRSSVALVLLALLSTGVPGGALAVPGEGGGGAAAADGSAPGGGGSSAAADADLSGGPPSRARPFEVEEDKNFGDGVVDDLSPPGFGVHLATGNASFAEEDVAVRTAGRPLSFVRYWNSASEVADDLGVGWTHSYSWRLASVAPLDRKLVHPDGHATYFRCVPRTGPCQSYVSDSGPEDRTTLAVSGDGFLFHDPGSGLRVTLSAADGLRATEVRYSTGDVVHLTRRGDVTEVTTGSGGAVYARVLLSRDAAGRVVSARVDGGPTWLYRYDGDLLVAVTMPTDRLAASYLYGKRRVPGVAEPLNDGGDPTNLTVVTNGAGEVTRLYSYDGRDRVRWLANGVLQGGVLRLGRRLEYDLDAGSTTVFLHRGDQAGELVRARYFFQNHYAVVFEATRLPLCQSFDADDLFGTENVREFDARLRPITDTSSIGTTAAYSLDTDGRRTTAAISGLKEGTISVAWEPELDLESAEEKPSVCDHCGAEREDWTYLPGTGLATDFSWTGFSERGEVVDLDWSYSYDALHRLTEAAGTDTGDDAVEYSYHEADVGTNAFRLAAVSDTAVPGAVTRLDSYSPLGLPGRTVFGAGFTADRDFDADGRTTVSRTTDDQSGEVLSTISFEYDLAGRPVSTTASDGRVTLFGYDEAGRPIDTLLFDGDKLVRVESVVLDSEDRVLERVTTDGSGREIEHAAFIWGPGGQLEAVGSLHPDPRRADLVFHHFAYDSACEIASRTDPKGEVSERVFTGEPGTTTITAPGDIYAYAYEVDYRSGARAVVDGGGRVSGYLWDDLNRAVLASDPNWGTVERFFDDVAHTEVLNVNDVPAVSTLRGPKDRVLEVDFLDEPGPDKVFHYDALPPQGDGGKAPLLVPFVGLGLVNQRFLPGNLAAMEDETGTTVFGYDRAGHRILEAKDVAGVSVPIVAERTLDARDDLTSQEYPDGIVVEYLTAVGDGGDVMTVTARLPDSSSIPIGVLKMSGNRLIEGDLGTTLRIDRTYARNGRVAAEHIGSLGWDATFDALGNQETILRADDSAESASFDAASRLIKWTATDRAATFTLDPDGNAVEVATAGVETTSVSSFTYEPGTERLTTIDDTARGVLHLEHDDAGRVRRLDDASGAARVFSYRPDGLLREVRDEADHALATYLYDGLDRRTVEIRGAGTIDDVKKRLEGAEGPEVRVLVWSPERQLLSELVCPSGAAACLARDYIYVRGNRVARLDCILAFTKEEAAPGKFVTKPVASEPAALYFYHHDHRGAPIALLDASGAIQWSARLDAWGEVLALRAEAGPFGPVEERLRLEGQIEDPATALGPWSAWYVTGDRHYLPSAGRFNRPDSTLFGIPGIEDPEFLLTPEYIAVAADYPWPNANPWSIPDPSGHHENVSCSAAESGLVDHAIHGVAISPPPSPLDTMHAWSFIRPEVAPTFRSRLDALLATENAGSRIKVKCSSIQNLCGSTSCAEGLCRKIKVRERALAQAAAGIHNDLATTIYHETGHIKGYEHCARRNSSDVYRLCRTNKCGEGTCNNGYMASYSEDRLDVAPTALCDP